ncbi:cell wall hydrolase [Novosphingobium terrae]|uniref:cell wall hydrolase n=1 Tax=Novosphingobium terrae TaxID=2726189 RepID=UPI001F12C60F|nr:cell wall hydrolase [Novosphingobium terrae]
MAETPIHALADLPRAADFRGRFSRRKPLTIARARRQHLHHAVGLRAAALSIAAVVVAASWQVQAQQHNGFAALTEDDSAQQVTPMPFERPGESFPGSAWYYLAAWDQLPGDGQQTLAPDAHDDSDPAPLTGPAGSARALIAAAAGQDHDRALQCLTSAIYYEAASEPDDGQRAVAQVVLNRVAHPSFPKTVCGVVFQGSEKSTGCQFTFTCDGALARLPSRYFWDRAQAVARAALAGYVFRPVGLATHYHTFAVHPYWDAAMNFIGQIGAHRFYRLPGPAGESTAFRFAYAGGEPLAAPHARNGQSADMLATADPLAVERAYDASLKQAGGSAAQLQVAAANAPAETPPAYTDDVIRRGGDKAYRASNLPGGLPGSDSVREDYRNSGQWIGTPQ